MKTDEHYFKIKVLSSDISELIGIPQYVAESFLHVIENLTIHKFLEEYRSEDVDGDFNDFEIEIPYFGTLVLAVEEHEGRTPTLSTNFMLRNDIFTKLKSGITDSTDDGPLVKQVYSALGEELVERYRSGVDINGDTIE